MRKEGGCTFSLSCTPPRGERRARGCLAGWFGLSSCEEMLSLGDSMGCWGDQRSEEQAAHADLLDDPA